MKAEFSLAGASLAAPWWIVLALLIAGCSIPGSRSGKPFDEIRRQVAGKSAHEIAQLLGEPDTRQEIFNSDERWIWWNYTYLDGNGFPPEVRGQVVHLEIVFRNPAPPHESRRPYADWRIARFQDWAFTRAFENVTKSTVGETLAGEALAADGRPAVVFTTSHGVGFSRDDPRQLRHQGGLLCSEWPGPRHWRGSIPEEHYFSADDVADNASPAGLVAFCFACYGAGTPRRDSFAHRDPSRGQIAPHDFVARLPQRLLGHPGGGALAVVGHVDRAWSYCFDWPQAEEQIEVFASAFGRLFDGYPVGAAMEYFNQRYAELSADLSFQIEEAKYEPERTDLVSLSGMWTANNDARSYVVIGDPAVRLSVAEG